MSPPIMSCQLPIVDTVVLTWNDGALLETAVSSALAQAGVVSRVVVVDNASDEQPKLPVDESVRVVRKPTNRGVAAARNQGVRIGAAEFILLLDSDAELTPGCVAALVAVLDAVPDAALAAPVFAGQAAEASAGRAPSVIRKLARGLGLTARYRGAPRDEDARQWSVDFAMPSVPALIVRNFHMVKIRPSRAERRMPAVSAGLGIQTSASSATLSVQHE